MTVAQLVGGKLLQARFVLLQYCLSQRLDRLVDRRCIDGIGERRGTVQQAPRANCERAGNRQISADDLHRLSIGSSWTVVDLGRRSCPIRSTDLGPRPGHLGYASLV